MNSFDTYCVGGLCHRYYVNTTDAGVATIMVIDQYRNGKGLFGMPEEVDRRPHLTDLTTEYADILCAMLNKRSVAAWSASRYEFLSHAEIGNLGKHSYIEAAASVNGNPIAVY